MSWWDDLPPELRPPASGGDDVRAAVLKAFSDKGIQPRDDADVQYWVDHINQQGGLANGYWQSRMAQPQGGVGDYSGGGGSGRPGGTLNSIAGVGGGGAPATYNYQQALDRVQQATGRTLSPQDIQGLFQRFGGNEQSTFTDEGLAPVIASLQGQAGGTGNTDDIASRRARYLESQGGGRISPMPDLPMGTGGMPADLMRQWNQLSPQQQQEYIASGGHAPTEAEAASGRMSVDRVGQWNRLTPEQQQAYIASGGHAPTGADSTGQDFRPPSVPDFTPPTVPAYQRYTPGPAPTPERFTAPTAEEARQTPGYQFALDQGNQALQRSAAARGGLLSGGTLKDIGAYNIGMADQNYQNVFGNRLAGTQTNNANALNAYNATTGANLAAGGLNLQGENQQFQNTYGPQWNAYLSQVGQGQFGANYGLARNAQRIGQGQFSANFGLAANAQQFGQGLATDTFNLGRQGQYFNQGLSNRLFELGAQGQYFNQGLSNRQFDLQRFYADLFGQNQTYNQGLTTNQNQYGQWNTNQQTAFDQWLRLAQLGYPGNPYGGVQ